MDPFQVLGITPKATAEEAQEAYRSLAQIFHPDRYADSSPRVREEAERRMKELTIAYADVKEALGTRSHTEATIELDHTDIGDPAAVAAPLPSPVGEYSREKWQVATRRWHWSDDLLAWECEHGREVCGSCGRNPDVIAVHDGGVVRPANTWRRSRAGEVVCVSHRDQWCRRCRPLPDEMKRRLERAAARSANVRQAPKW